MTIKPFGSKLYIWNYCNENRISPKSVTLNSHDRQGYHKFNYRVKQLA